MAAMTSTFLGLAVAVKAPVVAAKKAAVAPVASLDGLKKVRIGSGELQSGKTYPRRLTRGDLAVARASIARRARGHPSIIVDRARIKSCARARCSFLAPFDPRATSSRDAPSPSTDLAY